MEDPNYSSKPPSPACESVSPRTIVCPGPTVAGPSSNGPLADSWFRTVFQESPLGLEIYDSAGVLLEVNHACLSIFGVENPVEVLGFRLFEDPQLPEQARSRLLAGHRVAYQASFDFDLVREKGLFQTTRTGQAFLEVTITPLSGLGFLVQVVETTEQRERERALEESEERWRSYVKNSPHGVFIVDEGGRYLEVNPAACRMTGFREEELLEMTIVDLLAPESIQAGMDGFRNLLRGRNISEELAFIHRSGESRWWTVSAAPLGGGRFVGFTFDVTEQRRAQRALQESKLRQDAAVAGARVGLWDWDLRTSRVWYSKEWKAQVGNTEKEIGEGYEEWESRVHPEDLEKTLAKIQKALDGEAPGFSAEFRFRHKDASWRWIMTDASVFRDSRGNAVRVVGSHLDITERMAAQAETLQLKEELAHVQRLESVGRLAGGVAHDFNNMLNVIIGHTDLLSTELGLSPEAEESIGEIRQAARHSADLTRQLLGYARRQTRNPGSKPGL